MPLDKVAAVRERVEARYAAQQWREPEAFVVRASDGAHLVD